MKNISDYMKVDFTHSTRNWILFLINWNNLGPDFNGRHKGRHIYIFIYWGWIVRFKISISTMYKLFVSFAQLSLTTFGVELSLVKLQHMQIISSLQFILLMQWKLSCLQFQLNFYVILHSVLFYWYMLQYDQNILT